jgi:signal transduction histidine kinase
LAVEVSISAAVDSLSRDKQRSLLRIVQEALTNVYRHAKATSVDITIAARERAFQLEIRDDGQGMMVGDRLSGFRPPALGTGLRIMRDRLDEMGGRLEILSAPTAAHRGTCLRATVPHAFAVEPHGRRYAFKKSC